MYCDRIFSMFKEKDFPYAWTGREDPIITAAIPRKRSNKIGAPLPYAPHKHKNGFCT